MNIHSNNIMSDPINNPELEKHFWSLTNLIKSFRYNYSEVRLFAVSLIFIKRLIDIDFFQDKKIYSTYQKIRNRTIHDFISIRSPLMKLIELIGAKNSFLKQFLPPLPPLENLSYDNMNALNSLVSSLSNYSYDLNHFSEKEFGAAFNRFLGDTRDFKNGEYYTPQFIKELMVELLEIEIGNSIYDPAAGIGGFFIEAVNQLYLKGFGESVIKIIGQEKNLSTYSLFVMNLFMSGIYSGELFLGDTIIEPRNVQDETIIKYDRIVSEPPFGMSSIAYKDIYRNDPFSRYHYGTPGKNSTYGFIQHILSSLNEKGKAVVLLSQGVLYSSGKDMEIRKHLIEEDVFEAIIKLPSGILDFTIAEPVIIVFNHSKPRGRKNRIQIIDISKRYTAQEIKNIGVSSILSNYKSFKGKDSYSYNVELKDVINNEYNLKIDYYSNIYRGIIELLKNKEALRLENIAKFTKGIKTSYDSVDNDKKKSYLITIKNLNRDITTVYLETDSLELKSIKGKRISSRCILISLVGNELKPTIFDPERQGNPPAPITIGNNIVAIFQKEEMVKLEYLYYQFYSTEVQKQISIFRKGVIPNFSMAQLKKLVVPIPFLDDNERSLEAQDKYIIQQKQTLYELDGLRRKDKNKERDLKKASVETENTTIQILAHNLLPIVTNSSLALIGLRGYLENKNLLEDYTTPNEQIEPDPELLNHYPIQNNSETVKMVIERIEEYLEHMKNVIVKTRDVITRTIEEEDLNYCNLSEIMADYVEQKRYEYKGLFEIRLICPDEVYSLISETHFKEVLDNLIRNAEDHAFNDIKNIHNRFVEFEVEDLEEIEQVKITYRDNGKGMELTESEFFQKLKKGRNSSGFGLGGFYIKTIIQQMDGDVKLISNKRGMELKIILSSYCIGGGG